MGKRVFHFSEIVPVSIKVPKDGQGEMLARAAIVREQPLTPESRFCGAGVNSILPGGGIGLHTHAFDEEVYFIISGEGAYLDNDGERHPVKSGDAMFCLRGERHGLENTGSEPLVFAAAIAR